MEATKERILLRPIPKLEELADVHSKFGEVEEFKYEIEKLGEEY